MPTQRPAACERPLAARPLHPAEFAALLAALGPFEHRPRLAVGVSGGPDSMALALLAHEWAHERGGTALALIVDHGLRPEAAAEAAAVLAALAARGIASRVLRWRGAKPAAGIQAAARVARRELLETACREDLILHLLLAHHAADQAETVAMRAERGSGPAGRAGMPAVAEVAGLRLLRPLLAIPPERLRATLAARGAGWLADPSNRDPRFRRTRLRQDAAFDGAGWWAAGRVGAAARASREADLAAHLAAACRPHPLGFACLPASAASPPALANLARTIGGRDYPLPTALLERLTAWLAAGGDRRVGIGGCLWQIRRGLLMVVREPGRIRERLLLSPGSRLRWDGRFEVALEAGAGELALAAMGEAGRLALPAEQRRRLRRAGLPATAIAALPGLFRGSTLAACPSLGFFPERGVRASVRVRPTSPLAAAPFAGTNVVSNPQGLIYRAPAGVVPRAGDRRGPG